PPRRRPYARGAKGPHAGPSPARPRASRPCHPRAITGQPPAHDPGIARLPGYRTVSLRDLLPCQTPRRPPALQIGEVNGRPPPRCLQDRRTLTMAKRILAPIDRREPGELIVSVLGALARDSGATLRLLRVMPVPERVVGNHGQTVAYVDQEMARLTAEGRDDLQPLEEELRDVIVESVVRFGEPVEEILLEAEAFDADLIAL